MIDIISKIRIKQFFVKYLSLLVCAAVLLSALSIVGIFASVNAQAVWDGAAASSFAGGTGTKADPYLIENGGQLYKMVADYSNTPVGSKPATHTYFKITEDIDLNNKKWCWFGQGCGADTYISKITAGFSGIVDGGGHTISNLSSTGDTNYAQIGLIPVGTQGAEVRNLTVKSAALTGKNVGGVIFSLIKATGGNSMPIVIENCSVEDSTVSMNDTAGGLVGYIHGQSLSIANCRVVKATFAATGSGKSANAAAFFGFANASDNVWNNTLTVSKSFCSLAKPIGPRNTDWTNASTFTNVYTSCESYDGSVSGLTKLTDANMKGEKAKTAMVGLNFNNVWKTVADDYPTIEIRGVQCWDGSKDSDLDGSGTVDDPYLIETAAQLAYVVSTDLTDGLHFKLVNDIKINDTSTPDWKLSARNWVWADVRFVGTFDGDGHTIDGLYYNGNQWKHALFSYIGGNGTAIKNIKFTNASINTTYSGDGGAGILAAQLSASADISYIYVDETCEINAPNARGVAAIAPWCSNNGTAVTIDNCAVMANIVGKGYTGAFIGSIWTGNRVVTNCFTASNVPMSGNESLTNPQNNYALVVDTTPSGTTILANAEQMKGENAKTYMSGLDFDKIWKTVEGKYPIIEIREGTPTEPIEVPDGVWDGTTAENFAGGNGTESDPFIIEDGAQLRKMIEEYSTYEKSKGVYFKINNDIYLNNVLDGTPVRNVDGKQNWLKGYGNVIPTASKANSFNGILDGGNNTIYGLYIQGIKSAGLFPAISSYTVIKNLNFDNLLITGGNGYGGAIAGQAIYYAWQSAANITNCSVTNAVIGESANMEIVGGFLGDVRDCSVTFANCYSYDISLSNWDTKGLPGGIMGSGWNSGTVKLVNCYSVGYFPVNSNVKATCTNVYTDIASPAGNTATGIIVLNGDQMKGENAKTYMQGFDFDTSWKTVENGYPVHFVYTRPDYIWDGSTAESFAGGSGTPYDPYLIENGAQLYKMVKEYSNASGASGSVNKSTSFKLIKDIYLNDVWEKDLQDPSKEVWDTKFNGWYQVTSYSKGFCGDLDGDGHTVYGLYSNGGYSGLIPVLMDGGKVHNLNLKNSFIYGTESGGGIVGFVKAHWKMSPVSVTYCTVDNTVVKSTKKFVGGIIGGFADIKITVSDCAVTRSKLVSTNENPHLVSGIIGNGWGELTHTVTNCFTDDSVHPVTAAADKTNFDAIASKVVYTNVYTTAKKNFAAEGITYLSDNAKLKGTAAASTLKGFNFKNDWLIVNNDYPKIRKGAGTWTYDTSKAGEVWSGKIAKSYAGGDGSKAKPYEIKTGGQLALLANDALNGKTLDKYYKITADIILNDTSSANWQKKAKEWYTGSWAKAFRGYLDGGYHIISGIYLNKTADNYKGTDYYGGLFACIGQNAVIEKLGIVNSSITFTHPTATKYVGAFAGFVDQYNAQEAGYNAYPIIRQCFADTTVFLDSGSCGGFIGCATRPIRIENSFFTGKVNTVSRGLFGYSKMNKEYEDVLVKNFYTADSKYAIVSNNSYDNVKYENCYSSSAQDKAGITRLFIDRMCGTNAKTYMTGFDFNKIWSVRGKDETPGIKGFKANAYSNLMSPEDITVSFETNCDLVVEAITGKAYSKLTLPVIKRDGYVFDGWYAYPELDTPFTYDYFPTFNTILYAKWTLSGFYQDFENYEDSVYDYHEGIEYYRPTVPGYSAEYVHGGAKSIHRLSGTNEYLDFLLFYKEELEIGKNYKMVFYTTTDQDKASVDLSLVYLDWPDVYSANKGIQKIGTVSDLTDGKWVEHTVTFTAKSKWVAIRTEGDASVYFDDFTLYNTNDKADESDGNKTGEIGSVLSEKVSVFVIASVIAVIVSVGAILTVIFLKKRKKIPNALP